MMQEYTQEEIEFRAFQRAAYVIQSCWEDGSGIHTRLFDLLIPDRFIEKGESVKGRAHREHVVPCVLIVNECKSMFAHGRSIDDVAKAIQDHLFIVRISKDEAKLLDVALQLKTTMPEGWVFGESSPFARIKSAGIQLIK